MALFHKNDIIGLRLVHALLECKNTAVTEYLDLSCICNSVQIFNAYWGCAIL